MAFKTFFINSGFDICYLHIPLSGIVLVQMMTGPHGPSNGLMTYVPFTLLKILMHLFWMGPLEKLTGVLNVHSKAVNSRFE